MRDPISLPERAGSGEARLSTLAALCARELARAYARSVWTHQFIYGIFCYLMMIPFCLLVMYV